MDSYQAIYDATRSRIAHFDGSHLVQEIASRFDFSHYANMVKDIAMQAEYEKMRPSVLYRPSIQIDGNQWCALYGDNLQDGVAGFGDTPELAMGDFDKNWKTSKIVRQSAR